MQYPAQFHRLLMKVAICYVTIYNSRFSYEALSEQKDFSTNHNISNYVAILCQFLANFELRKIFPKTSYQTKKFLGKIIITQKI